jgi:excisionase family DNA binding protein
MAEKLPVIIDNRGENKVLHALQRFLPNLQRMDIATGVFGQCVDMKDVQSLLGVKRDTLYSWISREQMPSHRMGRLWNFRTEEVDEWVKSGGTDDAAGDGKRGRYIWRL